jgi:hypothetical protein
MEGLAGRDKHFVNIKIRVCYSDNELVGIFMKLINGIMSLIFINCLSGCVVVSAAVGVTTIVVGGVVEVVDTVTPDIFDGDDDEDDSDDSDDSDDEDSSPES